MNPLMVGLKNTNTTMTGVGLILAALGTVLAKIFDGDPETVPDFQTLMMAIMALLAGTQGILGRDADKSSQSTGVG